MYRITVTIATVAMALGVQPAHATPPQSAPSLVVHYADLDLSRNEGAAVLYQRLRVAAETVCLPLDDLALPRHAMFRACVANAISAAVAKVDRPSLTTYYRARQGERNAVATIAKE